MQINMNNRTTKIVVTGIMIAMAIILNRLIPATPIYHLTLDFVPITIIAYYLGPVWAGIAYGICDALGSIVFPFGAYNPMITVSLVLIGVFYGFVLYKKEISGKMLFARIVIASFGAFLIKLFITTYALWPYYGADGTYMAYVIARIPNCIAILIAQLVVMPLIYKFIIQKIQ
ncbi:MAG: folate family ECF transporter S component [Clostridia bacterium]|nr:folate family ECF transporter S component [Clostridia bacterium]